MIGLRAKVRRCDKNYLLHWSIVQVKRHLFSIRASAARRFPDIPFEKIALFVNLRVWPIQFLLYPLERVSYVGPLTEIESPEAIYYMELVLQRVERGCKDAKMLTIQYNDGQSFSTKFFAVSLEEPAVETLESMDWDHLVAGWSGRQCAVDEEGGSMKADRDDIDKIMERIMIAGQRTSENLWTHDLVKEYVDKYVSRT